MRGGFCGSAAGSESLCWTEPGASFSAKWDARRDEVRLAVVERRRHPEPASRITLLQAVPKGRIMEAIIQKATELGVARIGAAHGAGRDPARSGGGSHA